MRVATAFNRLLNLEGANVTAVDIGSETVEVTVGLRRRRLVCPVCDFSTSARYDTRPEWSWCGTWRWVPTSW